MWLVTLLLGASVIYLMNYWVNSHFNDWKKRGIPYSRSFSPFSSLFRFIFTEKGIFDLITEAYEKMDGHRFAGCFNMFTPSIMIRDPDLIYQICVKDFSYFVDRILPTDISDLFMDGLANLTGDKWRTLRHKMTPSFTSGKLRNMFNPIKECCDDVLNFINRKNGQDIETRDIMFKYSINIIGNVSFGLKVDALNEETENENEFLKVSRLFFKPSIMLILKTMISLTIPNIRKYLKFSLVDTNIEKFFRELVKNTMTHREKTGERRNDFLQLMMDQKEKELLIDSVHGSQKLINSLKSHAEEPEDSDILNQLKYMHNGNDDDKFIKVFTDDSIVAQAFTFISAGSETIAAALSLILFDLAVNPVLQNKLKEEIDVVLSKDGFTYNAIRDMKYMEQIMYESFRIHRVGGFVGRICTKDYKIPNTDVVIAKGTFVTVPVIAINYDPQYYPNPEKFDPDRFQKTEEIHPGIFLPFGTGPRMCIAKRLAILEIKMLLTALLKTFSVALSPKTKMPLKIQKSSVLHHVEGGVWLKFKNRSN